MILVTGGTGFIGQVLIRHLVSMGYQVRTLLRPSQQSPNLPVGVAVEAIVCSLKDERGLRAAMRDVEAVFHLAGAEGVGSRADLQGVDIEGSRLVATAALDADVGRLVYVSHLGADRASAYAVLKAKGIAEHHIMQSGVPYTILRSAIVYGPGDRFTTALASVLRMSPWFFLLPGDGNTYLQPIWVDDLVTGAILAMESPECAGHVYSIGGPEYLTFRSITEMVAKSMGVRRTIVPVPASYLRILTVWVENSPRGFPLGSFWQDYLAADRTCELDTLPRLFGLMPERFNRKLDYLRPDELAGSGRFNLPSAG
jgi:nucleoside-diphosphate-sugar epimerase